MRCLILPVLLLAIASFARAQGADKGSVEGVVSDPTASAVPGATVRLTNSDTDAVRSAATNQAGLFRFPMLPVGTYTLEARHEGFAPLIEKGLVVTVGSRVNLSLYLGVAGREQAVVVNASTPLVETTRSQVSYTVGRNLIAGLPTNGRNFLDFIVLTPGVTRGSRGFDFSFGGQRKMNLLRVDGSDNDNTFFGEVLGLSSSGFAPYQFSLATVEEFQVHTNSYSAETGRAGGGVVDVVTKSGTNDLHGSLFWYYRDRSMNATDLVNRLNHQPKSPYHFNQFGGTLGGPLRRDKLFFFLAYDGQRSSAQNEVSLNLPPGFALSSDPTVACFQLRALDYLAGRDASWIRTFNQNVYFAKADWAISPAHLLTARWNRQRFTGDGVENQGPQNAFEHTGASISHTDAVAVALTSTFSPSLANTARFSYVRSAEPGLTNSISPEANVFQSGQLVLTVGRAPRDPRAIFLERFQEQDTLSFLRGRHAFKFGADVAADLITFFTSVNFSGSYQFNSLESFGRSLASTPAPIAGEFYRQAFSGEGTHGATVHPNFIEYAGFAQDEWRVRPRLTFNLGLRYDLQAMAKPHAQNPSPELMAAGLDTSFTPLDADNIAPRLGLAWAPLPSNRLVLRMGYGIFYARTPGLMSARPFFQNGLTVQTLTFSAGTPGATLIPAYPNTLCGSPDPSGLPPNCAAPVGSVSSPILILFSPEYQQPYVQQGSLGFEFQLQKNWALSATYLLVKGTRLQRLRDINLATPETPTTIGVAETPILLTYQTFTLPRPIVGFDRIEEMESAASSIYHGLALQVHKRFSKNFEFLASYTFSKVIDDAPEPTAVNPGPDDQELLSDPSNPSADRGPGANDQRHRFVLSGVWKLNYAHRLSPAARAILGGWEISGIFTAQTGLPYSGFVNFDLNKDGNGANDRTPGLGRNTFHMRSSLSLDPRVARNFALSERTELQLIWEAFNVLNHANVTDVRKTQYARSTSPVACGIAGIPCLVPQITGVTAFATPTLTSGPRIMQFSVRLAF